MPDVAANQPTNQPEEPITTRRDFLTLAWKSALWLSGVLGIAGVVDFFSYIPDASNPSVYDLGPVDQLPENSIILIQQAQAALIPTSQGFVALSLVCPHLGCMVDVKDQSFDCPCHGSRFAQDGSLQKGPASQGLRSLLLTTNPDGHLLLDISESPE